MKDFKNDPSATLARFGRDKRTRMTSQAVEQVERRSDRKNFTNYRNNDETKYDRQTADYDGRYRQPKRASYNPNFTEDNRPVGEQPRQRTGSTYRQDSRRTQGGGRYEGEKRYAARQYGDAKPQKKYGRQAEPRRFYDENGDIDGNRADTQQHEYGRTQKPYRKNAYGQAGGETPNRGYAGRKDNRQPAGRQSKPYAAAGGGYDRKRQSPARKQADKLRTYPKYNPNVQTGEMRLNRFIAQSGICSRREADDFIAAGLVTVNGKTVTELGVKVMPGDDVRFNDTRIQGEHKVYLVLNKPKGFVTSLDDPHADKTVMDLVKGACTERIYPVGRLDKNSVGLLLFTNDGDLTRQLTHPSLQKKKVYQVSLDKPLTHADMESIAQGITLDDGEIYADEIAYVKENKKEIGIEIHSGRNRIVRRIFEHLGYSVQKLDRVYYAGLTKKNLKRGAWRFLTKEEVARLKSGLYE